MSKEGSTHRDKIPNSFYPFFQNLVETVQQKQLDLSSLSLSDIVGLDSHTTVLAFLIYRGVIDYSDDLKNLAGEKNEKIQNLFDVFFYSNEAAHDLSNQALLALYTYFSSSDSGALSFAKYCFNRVGLILLEAELETVRYRRVS